MVYSAEPAAYQREILKIQNNKTFSVYTHLGIDFWDSCPGSLESCGVTKSYMCILSIQFQPASVMRMWNMLHDDVYTCICISMSIVDRSK